MEELVAVEVFKEVKYVLDAHNIEYWLNFGALLGAVRDGRFISYDDDIELNAWKHKISEQQMRDICKDLCERGFNAYYSTLTDYISIRKNNIPIAFSMYTLNGNKAVRPHEPVQEGGLDAVFARWFFNISEIFARKRVGKINAESVLGVRRFLIFTAVTVTGLLPEILRRKLAIFFRDISIRIKKGYGRTSIPAEFYMNLQDLEFYGQIFKVPCDVERYLEFVYGPDWRIPLENWNFHDHDKRSITSIEFVDQAWDY